jgi:hypothetical protein
MVNFMLDFTRIKQFKHKVPQTPHWKADFTKAKICLLFTTGTLAPGTL